MDSLLDTVVGLPLHPLVVHAVVVLLPLSALGSVLMAVRPSFSHRFGVLVVIVAAIGVGSAVVAKESGERLALRVGVPQQHFDYGRVLPFIALGYFVILLAFWLVDRGVPLNRPRPGWLVAVAVLLVIASLAVTYWTVRTGHTGAQATWTKVIANTRPAGG